MQTTKRTKRRLLPERPMKKHHRMEAKAPEPDDLTSEGPIEPTSGDEGTPTDAEPDVSAPHVPPVKR